MKQFFWVFLLSEVRMLYLPKYFVHLQW